MDTQLLVDFISKQKTDEAEIGKETAELLVMSALSKPCFSCSSKEVSHVGTFVPKSSTEFGGYKDKARMFLYGVCDECIGLDDVGDRVEERIMSGLKSRQ